MDILTFLFWPLNIFGSSVTLYPTLGYALKGAILAGIMLGVVVRYDDDFANKRLTLDLLEKNPHVMKGPLIVLVTWPVCIVVAILGVVGACLGAIIWCVYILTIKVLPKRSESAND